MVERPNSAGRDGQEIKKMKKLLAILMAAVLTAGAAWAQDGGGEPVTQAQLADVLVKALGMVSSLPGAASDQQKFEILMQNGIAPDGGWDAQAPVTKKDLVKVLVQALDAEDEVENPEDPASWQAVLEEHGIDMASLNSAETVLDMEALPTVVATDYGVESVDPLLTDDSPARISESYATRVESTSWSLASIKKIVTQVTTPTTTHHKKKPTPH